MKAPRPGDIVPKNNEELLAMLKKQYKAFTGPKGNKYRKALGVTDADISDIKSEIAALEKIVAQERIKLN